VLSGGEKLFRSDLASSVATDAAPVLFLQGSVTTADGTGRLNKVQVLGVDGRFWELAPAADKRELKPGDAVVNAAMAESLGVALGESVILRVEKPSLFSRDAPLSGEEEVIESIRVRVVAVADDAHFGRFSLQASQLPPVTIFLPLEMLQKRLEVPGKANLLLSSSLTASELQKAVLAKWTLEDATLQLKDLPGSASLELRSSQVFLDPQLVAKIPAGEMSLTYFVNSIGIEDRSTPYSMVTAVAPGSLSFVPPDLAEDEVVVSQWLADDLLLKSGDLLELKYFVMGERRALEEKSRSLRVRAIVEPRDAAAWDGSWMPDFPGLADVGNCRDWKPGFALSLDRIRDKDELYWKQFKGTPKAFISIKAGQEMWSNRWGSVTGIRYAKAEVTERGIQSRISPADIGFQIYALRDLAFAATEAPVDFAGLFGGFSFFLILAALALVGLLFGLMIEKRREEAGTLMAFGWSYSKVRLLFLGEGSLTVCLGGLLGGACGLLYTKGILWALKSVWKGATSGVEITFFAAPASIAFGVFGSVIAALIAMIWVCRKSWREPVRLLLAGESVESTREGAGGSAQGRFGKWGTIILGSAGLLLAGVAFWRRETDPALFFSGGMLCLISALGGSRLLLARLATGEVSAIRHLAWRNIGRRSGRALVIVGVLASGAFLILSVEVFRKGEVVGELPRASGTGGFALIGELASPIYEDLNAPNVRDSLGLPKEPSVHVVMLREKAGDEASCLNLNRAVQPRVLGVPSAELEKMGAFRFSRKSEGWASLRLSHDGVVPAVADEATILWALQKKVGDELTVPDGRGGNVRLKLVAALSGSILQGSLIIDENAFERLFPSLGGYRMLLLDAPNTEFEQVRAIWTRALSDRGLELVGATRRLAELDAVANTYLSIFQVLGGLGVLLGALGVGVVTARNIVERRVELALLQATGWRLGQVRRLLGWEHCLLVTMGALVGGVCVVIVTLPVQWIRGEVLNYRPLLNALGVLLVFAMGAVWIGILSALQGRIGDALKAE